MGSGTFPPSPIPDERWNESHVNGHMETKSNKFSAKTTGEPEVHCPVNSQIRAHLTSVSWRANIHFATLSWAALLNGWNDASNGPLLPRIQQVYHVGYAVVSMVFVFTTLGYIAGSISNMFLTERIGFGKILVIGSFIQVIAYSIEAAAVPYPAFLFAYTINGYGIALQAAQNVGYVARFTDNPGLRMGLLMGGTVFVISVISMLTSLLALYIAYGVGALLAPLSATHFSQSPYWSYHYLICFGIAILNTIFLMGVFRLRRQEECLAEIGITSTEKGTSSQNLCRQIMALREVHLLAAFILCYVGAEVTIGGWIVTYIIDDRHGGSSSGYISTGFWAGLTIGRVALVKVNKLVREPRVLFVYAFLAIALEFVVWFVPSLISNAVAMVCVGILLGPMYPLAVNHAGRVLPQRLLTGAIGWITGSGQAGSALIPFVTGAIAQRAGMWILQPVLVAVFTVMTVFWLIVSRTKPR